MKLQKISALASDESATSLLEFTLCVTVILTAVFGIMDVSRALYTEHFVVNAARQGVRYAIVRGSNFTGTSCTTVSTANCAATQGNVVRYVKSLAPAGTSTANLTVTPTWPGTDGSGAVCVNAVRTANSSGCVANVNVTYSYSFMLPFLPANLMKLTSSASMTIAE
jgi:Flp pilus assembly protein TadG